MKELVKPSNIEQEYSEVVLANERTCCGPNYLGGYCDKHCTRGSSNNSSLEDDDILF